MQSGVMCLAASVCTHRELGSSGFGIRPSGWLSHKVNTLRDDKGGATRVSEKLRTLLRGVSRLIRSGNLCTVSSTFTPLGASPVAQTAKRLSLPIKHGAPIALGFGQGVVEMPSTLIEDQPHAGHDCGLLTVDLCQAPRTEILRDFCSANTAARLFSMHRRTLHRHLQAEGRTFRQVTNEVRFEIARDLLDNTALAIGQMAAVLQYSETRAFTRTFQRRSGQPPSAWRSNHRGLEGW
jgi:AraC-like DNA-binding protein